MLAGDGGVGLAVSKFGTMDWRFIGMWRTPLGSTSSARSCVTVVLAADVAVALVACPADFSSSSPHAATNSASAVAIVNTHRVVERSTRGITLFPPQGSGVR